MTCTFHNYHHFVAAQLSAPYHDPTESPSKNSMLMCLPSAFGEAFTWTSSCYRSRQTPQPGVHRRISLRTSLLSLLQLLVMWVFWGLELWGQHLQKNTVALVKPWTKTIILNSEVQILWTKVFTVADFTALCRRVKNYFSKTSYFFWVLLYRT